MNIPAYLNIAHLFYTFCHLSHSLIYIGHGPLFFVFVFDDPVSLKFHILRGQPKRNRTYIGTSVSQSAGSLFRTGFAF